MLEGRLNYLKKTGEFEAEAGEMRKLATRKDKSSLAPSEPFSITGFSAVNPTTKKFTAELVDPTLENKVVVLEYQFNGEELFETIREKFGLRNHIKLEALL